MASDFNLILTSNGSSNDFFNAENASDSSFGSDSMINSILTSSTLNENGGFDAFSGKDIFGTPDFSNIDNNLFNTISSEAETIGSIAAASSVETIGSIACVSAETIGSISDGGFSDAGAASSCASASIGGDCGGCGGGGGSFSSVC